MDQLGHNGPRAPTMSQHQVLPTPIKIMYELLYHISTLFNIVVAQRKSTPTHKNKESYK
jgi:hypothetical protein